MLLKHRLKNLQDIYESITSQSQKKTLEHRNHSLRENMLYKKQIARVGSAYTYWSYIKQKSNQNYWCQHKTITNQTM